MATVYELPLPLAPPAALSNEWSPELERESGVRIQTNLQTLRGQIITGRYGNIHFENENMSAKKGDGWTPEYKNSYRCEGRSAASHSGCASVVGRIG